MAQPLTLDERRRRARLGVGELARKAGVSRVTLWRVLRNRRDAYASTRDRIEAALSSEERQLAAELGAVVESLREARA